MKYNRTLRISEEIKKIVSELIMSELKDPGIAPFTTVTRVETTNDLRFANIYVSILGQDEGQEQTLEALNRAKGFVRRQIGNELNLRYTPEPVFKYDSSIEYSRHMSDLIESLNIPEAKDEEAEENEDREMI